MAVLICNSFINFIEMYIVFISFYQWLYSEIFML